MPPLPHPIPEELLSLVARRFHLLAEPMRLRLLDRLRNGEATVQRLADELGTSQQNEPSQQNVSKHLMLLTDAAMLARRGTARTSATASATRRSSVSASRCAGPPSISSADSLHWSTISATCRPPR